MSQVSTPTDLKPESYQRLIRRPLNNLAIILPLLVFFQIGASIYGTDAVLRAPQYLRGVLQFFGATATLLPAVCIVAVLLVQHLVHHDPWKPSGTAIAGMVGESILWTVPLIAVSYMTGKIVVGQIIPPDVSQALQHLLLAVGAGIYEEFLFRMVLISVLMLLLVDVMGLKRDVMTVLAVLAAAVLFGLCHFTLAGGGADFVWSKFIFLSTAGMLWGSLFIFRGFAVAVGSHVVWDIYVLVASPVSPLSAG
jgi:membrane protease YdiL (CAAX protease family)